MVKRPSLPPKKQKIPDDLKKEQEEVQPCPRLLPPGVEDIDIKESGNPQVRQLGMVFNIVL